MHIYRWIPLPTDVSARSQPHARLCGLFRARFTAQADYFAVPGSARTEASKLTLKSYFLPKVSPDSVVRAIPRARPSSMTTDALRLSAPIELIERPSL